MYYCGHCEKPISGDPFQFYIQKQVIDRTWKKDWFGMAQVTLRTRGIRMYEMGEVVLCKTCKKSFLRGLKKYIKRYKRFLKTHDDT